MMVFVLKRKCSCNPSCCTPNKRFITFNTCKTSCTKQRPHLQQTHRRTLTAQDSTTSRQQKQQAYLCRVLRSGQKRPDPVVPPATPTTSASASSWWSPKRSSRLGRERPLARHASKVDRAHPEVMHAVGGQSCDLVLGSTTNESNQAEVNVRASCSYLVYRLFFRGKKQPAATLNRSKRKMSVLNEKRA